MKPIALAAGCLACLAVACGGSADSTFPADTTTPPPLAPAPALDPGTSAPAVDDCAAAAKLVYVVTQQKDLYSFAPDTLTFTKIGRLVCPVTGSPSSMAVDRSGTAWVSYANGELFKVSTADATCTQTSFVPNQAGFTRFGMAFATNGTRTSAETLFVSGLAGTSDGKGLGKLDLATMKITMLGDYSADLAAKPAELTGTGDGRLYGFFATTPATLALIEKTAGATSADKPLDGVGAGNAFAFSFWGGDFWFYTSDGTTPSRVTRLKSTGEVAVVKDDVGGFRIDGAGVSTCAPLTFPR